MSKSVMLKASTGVDSTMFIQSGATIGDKPVDSREARKRVANLVRQAWELALEAKGLGVFEQAGGRKVFYVTPELTKGRGEKVAFLDVANLTLGDGEADVEAGGVQRFGQVIVCACASCVTLTL